MRRRPHPSLALLSLTLLPLGVAACGDSGGSDAAPVQDAAVGGTPAPGAVPRKQGRGKDGRTNGHANAAAGPALPHSPRPSAEVR